MKTSTQSPSQARSARAHIQNHTPTLRGTRYYNIDDYYNEDLGTHHVHTFGIIDVSYWDTATQSWVAHKDLLVQSPHGLSEARSEFFSRLYKYLPKRFHTFVKLDIG